MKRWFYIMMAIVVVFGALDLGFATFAQSRPVSLQVQVAGAVDEVSLYSSSNEAQPVATIRTGGQNVSQSISLPTSEQYYYVAKKGAQTYRSRPIGFGTAQDTAYLTIHGLNSYEVSNP